MRKEKFLILVIISSLFLMSCCVSKPKNRQNYSSNFYEKPPAFTPSWFKKLPESQCNAILGVGYAGKYTDTVVAKNNAIERALKNVAKQIRVRLIFKYQEYSDDRFVLSDPQYNLYYEESILDKIREDYEILDSLFNKNGYFILIVYPSKTQVEISRDITSWGKKPKWVEALPKSADAIYGIGIASKYSSWVRAWDDVDEYSRFNLLSNLEIKIESDNFSYQNNRFGINFLFSKQYSDLTLTNSVIIGRWFDEKDNEYYSLCRQSKPVSD